MLVPANSESCDVKRQSTPFAADSGFAAEGMRREPAELSFGKGVLPVPPLPLKPTVGRLLVARIEKQ
jgi:hypothetical protein